MNHLAKAGPTALATTMGKPWIAMKRLTRAVRNSTSDRSGLSTAPISSSSVLKRRSAPHLRSSASRTVRASGSGGWYCVSAPDLGKAAAGQGRLSDGSLAPLPIAPLRKNGPDLVYDRTHGFFRQLPEPGIERGCFV
jgi:hypothetical protein